MNASESLPGTTGDPEQGRHLACLSLGSNIRPEDNVPRAVQLLRHMAQVVGLSGCWETRAVGSDGPNFINMAVCLVTDLDTRQLKEQVIGSIEQSLGRVRTGDKNAPRTIDLDIIVYDQQVLDESLWHALHLALPFSELCPDLINPESGQTLRQVAISLQQQDAARLRADIFV